MAESIALDYEPPASPPPAPTHAPSVGKATARGAMWLAAASLASQGIQFLGTIVVARYLIDDDYGIYYTAMMVVSIAAVFVSFGFSPAIVSGRMTEPKALITSHWIICFSGIVLAAMVYFIGRPVAWIFFYDPKLPHAAQLQQMQQVTRVIAATSLMLVFNAWRVVPDALLRRDGKFNLVAVTSVVSQIFATIIGIILAIIYKNVWALVAPALVNAVVGTCLSIGLSRLSIRLQFHFHSVRTYLAECWHMMSNSFTNWFFDVADTIVIRKILGNTVLGTYGFSQNLVEKSMDIFSRTVSSPLLSSLGPLRDNLQRLDRAVVRACNAIARVTFPIAGGGIVMCAPIMTTLLGHKWDHAIPVVQVFFLLGAMQSVGQISGPVWQAMGRTKLVLYWGLTSNLSIVLAFLAGALIPGASALTVAIAYTGYSLLVLTPLVIWATRKWCDLPLRGLIPGLLRVLRDVGIMCAVVAAGRFICEHELHIRPVITLVPLVILGAFTYIMLFRFLSTEEMQVVISALPGKFQRLSNRLMALPRA